MGQQFGGSRPAARPRPRELFERARWRYYQVPTAARRLSILGILVASGVLAALVGWSVTETLLYVGLLLAIIAFTMRSPPAMATAGIAICWLFLVVPLAALYPVPAMQGTGLAVLALPVGLLAHRVRFYRPWQTALLAFLAAGVATAAFANVLSFLHVLPAWVAAAAMLGYRWYRGRKLAPTDDRYGYAQEGQGYGYAGGYGGPPGQYGQYGEYGQPGHPQQGNPQGQGQQLPEISVDEALGELTDMIGLDPVKQQINSIAASIEAAHRRAEAGIPTEKPMRHFVFVGPPGTGKTTVARITARIFYAFGLLQTPYVVEAQRSDLVGEHLGGTAIKTNELIDRAFGGVLFIDEAYSLVNAGDGQPDRFGNEAVQTLLKRAEDDREELVIILAGYEQEMETFLASNPGLGSRFDTRVKFPSYQPAELLQLVEYHLAARGEQLTPDARPSFWRMFEDVGRRGIVDDLGNGRFIRSLTEAATRNRDVRVIGDGSGQPTQEDLVTIHPQDAERAFAEITERHRGYVDTPSLDEALGELDSMIGLGPVKQQVHAIAAQLQVARVREEQGLVRQPPTRHFVFAGPPGTGKTTVARVVGRIFAALGLLARPAVVEAQRLDLVGEHLGSTAVKTNKLIDSALGGVLFIDEAYSLHNPGYSGGDAFGAEAVQTLLKRAEDDRDRLVIILAGYEADMRRFLGTNPGLASRFDVRVDFPSYTPEELRQIADAVAADGGDTWEPSAGDVLDEIFDKVCRHGRIADLGNGRFVRSLFEKACTARDVRIAHLGSTVTTAQLTTLTSADVRAAYEELAASLR